MVINISEMLGPSYNTLDLRTCLDKHTCPSFTHMSFIYAHVLDLRIYLDFTH